MSWRSGDRRHCRWPRPTWPIPRTRAALRHRAPLCTVAEIAEKLFLSEGTVRNYLSAAIAKAGARNRTEAVRTADEKGWL